MSAGIAIALSFAVGCVAWGQAGARDEIVELQSGDKVIVRADGTMGHYDRVGVPIPMPEGVVMTAKDGTRLIMKHQSLWRSALEVAGHAYGRATTVPFAPKTGGRRVMELQDGGRVEVDATGDMVHYDSKGRRVPMKDDEVMKMKDGSRILMINGSAWQEAARSPSTDAR